MPATRQGQRPWPSPGTNSPQDCLCPGSVHQPGVASRNSLRELRSLRSNKRAESVYEARCARQPQACASRRHPNRPQRIAPGTACRDAPVVLLPKETGVLGEGTYGQAAARLRGAEKRRARGRARSALRKLTRRTCSNAANEVRVVSCATGHETEHRRAAGAKRRPPRRSVAACPYVPLPQPSDAKKTGHRKTAKGRMPPFDPGIQARPDLVSSQSIKSQLVRATAASASRP